MAPVVVHVIERLGLGLALFPPLEHGVPSHAQLLDDIPVRATVLVLVLVTAVVRMAVSKVVPACVRLVWHASMVRWARWARSGSARDEITRLLCDIGEIVRL